MALGDGNLCQGEYIPRSKAEWDMHKERAAKEQLEL